MTRLGVFLSVFATLGLVWAGTAAADHPSAANNAPGCNGTIFLTGDASGGGNGTDPQYTQGEVVHVTGDMFDADDLAFTYEVWTDPPSPQQGTVVASGSLSGDGSGHIPTTAVYDTSNATQDGPYKVLVSWSGQGDNPDPCTKSKNFKLQLAGGVSPGGTTTTTGGTTTTTGGVSPAGTTTTGGTTGVGTTGGTGGVAGEQAAGGQAGELPFTGLPVWIPALAAVALLTAGFALLRRRAPTDA